MQFNQTPTLVPLAFAANGTKNTIPEASQISVTPGAASLNDGFPPLTFTPIAAGGVPPSGADFNGILNLITQSIRWAHAGGTYGYNSAFAGDANVGGYPRGALLLSADQSGMWLNQTDGNTANPDTGGAGWVPAFASGTVGKVCNLVSNVSAASSTKTTTADEIMVATALGGRRAILASFSGTGNLATTGLNGMDTGSPPASGFVAEYAVYNPTTGAKGLLYQNATAAKVPEQYGGANPVSGFTMSQLTGVWRTNASGQFAIGLQQDRKVAFVPVSALSTTSQQASYTALSLSSIVPLNAKSIDGDFSSTVAASGSASISVGVASTLSQIGLQLYITNNNWSQAGQGFSGTFSGLLLANPQTMYYVLTLSAGSLSSASISINSYTF